MNTSSRTAAATADPVATSASVAAADVGTEADITVHDVVVVGGGPAGATAAHELALAGLDVVLLDRAGRIKPCGGAVPPQMLVDFDVPRSVLEAEVGSARMVSPSAHEVDMPIGDDGFVGMVDRGTFDEWLRVRAAEAGARRIVGSFVSFGDSADGAVELRYSSGRRSRDAGTRGDTLVLRARYVIGADGAKSRVGMAAVPGVEKMKSVFAYHEIVEAPQDGSLDGRRCDVVYDGGLSPDFYSWVFPHGDVVSIGTGTAVPGHGLRAAVTELRARSGLADARTVRTEGAPLPLKPLKRWDDGRHVVLCGDAAGCVAPASGEGIFYAMTCGRMVADTVREALVAGDARLLKRARKRFMKKHGLVFLILGTMQHFWYGSDKRRERFVTMCKDPDVQRLTWESYLNKKIVRKDPLAHLKIFVKDSAHLLGIGASR